MLCNSLAAVLNGLIRLTQLVYNVAFEQQLHCQSTFAGFLDESLVWQIIIQAKSAQCNVQQPTVGDQIRSGTDISYVFAEVVDVAAQDRPLFERCLLAFKRSLKKRPAGVATERYDGLERH